MRMSQGQEGPRICVLGLGNLMRTDDAAGMLALRRLAADAGFPRDVEVVEGETLGLDLLHDVFGVSHLLVLDAVDTGAAPGTLTRFEGQEVIDLPTSRSVHLLGLSDLIQVLRLMGAPAMEIVLLGVQPESTEWGTVLTAAVDAAQAGLVEAALAQLGDWRASLGGAAQGSAGNSVRELVAS
jgi:hydrogenase maturation protease